jgi:TRAP-type C4-dicarboxylate transport system permease small subunit
MPDELKTPAAVDPEARMARLLDLSLGYLLAALVLVMMLLTFVDVVGRQGFNAPVPAGFEVTELLMGFTVYLGLPLVCARGEHITIGLLDNLFRGHARRIQGIVLNLLCCLMTLVWTRELWIHAGKIAADEEVLMFLKIGKAQFIYAMFGLTLLAAAVFLVLAWTRFRTPLHTPGNGG